MSFKSLMCSLKWLIQMLLQCFNKIYEQYLKESNVDALQEQSTNHQIWKSNYHFYTNCHVKPMIVSLTFTHSYLTLIQMDKPHEGKRVNSQHNIH